MASNAKFERSRKIAKDFADHFVRIALEKDLEKKEEGKDKLVLLGALVGETRDPLELCDQILQTLLAGRDTTSSLLNWVLVLARSPTEFKKLREVVSYLTIRDRESTQTRSHVLFSQIL
jgi:cytochrome P450